jgi:hypothetical protein
MTERGNLRAVNPLPGMRVRHPGQSDWGIGQVQSAIGNRVTVTFEHGGKQVINTAVITLIAADAIPPSP